MKRSFRDELFVSGSLCLDNQNVGLINKTIKATNGENVDEINHYSIILEKRSGEEGAVPQSHTCMNKCIFIGNLINSNQRMRGLLCVQ